ncbi:MAG: hypothetical protein SOT15_01350, partial [Treponema sp.]|nr:hypothetical protein [Treponema sp.]
DIFYFLFGHLLQNIRLATAFLQAAMSALRFRSPSSLHLRSVAVGKGLPALMHSNFFADMKNLSALQLIFCP